MASRAHGSCPSGSTHSARLLVATAAGRTSCRAPLQAVEFTKLMALLSAILTILSLAAYVALMLAWGLREIDCNSACAALPSCVPGA